jgi:hypothetical protein
MAKTTSKEERFWEQLDALGEAEVRLKLATGFYGGPQNYDRRPLAEEWLRRREQQRAEGRDQSTRKIAIASIMIATVLSVIAIAISIVALYK